MVFSSQVFLFLFLPVTYVLYLICPGIRIKNIILIIASLVFYAYGEPFAVLLMLASIFFNYLFGLVMNTDKRKLWLIISIVFNVAMLYVFKYLTYTFSILSSLGIYNLEIPVIGLPAGISFFTFQAMSYVIDSYKNPALIKRNILDICLYISFFPQLIAGPIIKFDDIARQISERTISSEKMVAGIKRFVCGLSKKIIIANAMGEITDCVFSMNMNELNIVAAWIGAACYVLQIYFDFSGYSDMAIGLGKLFGFEFKENFNYPLSSRGMTDFWRRWNISVSSWFKEYVYIPLGGNRKGRFRTVINKFVVFILTGVWHGANLTFLVWGLVHGFFLMLESFKVVPQKLFTSKYLRSVLHVYSLLVITFTFVIFRADNISVSIQYMKSMLCGFDFSIGSGFTEVISKLSVFTVIIFVSGVILSTPIVPKLRKCISGKVGTNALYIGEMFCTLVLFVLCVIMLSGATYNPFIYFRF